MVKEAVLLKQLTYVYCQPRPKLDRFTSLKEHFVDNKFKHLDVIAILCLGITDERHIKKKEQTAKIMNMVCVLAGIEKSSELVARLFFTAASDSQISSAISFTLSLTPFYPNVMNLAVKYLIYNIKELTSEITPAWSNYRSSFPPKARFLRNLLLLLKWEKGASADSPLKCLGLHTADLDSEVLERLMEWMLSFLNTLRNNGGLTNVSVDVIGCFMDLVLMLRPLNPLPVKSFSRLLVQFNEMMVFLLLLVNKENFNGPMDGVNLNSPLLFGTISSCDGADLTQKYPSNASKLRIEASRMACIDDQPFTLLKELRSQPISSKSINEILNSGVLKRRTKNSEPLTQTESEYLRIHLLVYMIENICLDGDAATQLVLSTILGDVLTQHFSIDGITNYVGWNRRPEENKQIDKYSKIAKVFDRMPFLHNLFTTISSIGMRGVLSILPLIRAYFIMILSRLEATQLKDDRVSVDCLNSIAMLFSNFIVARFIPEILKTAYNVISKASNHEAYTILLLFWKLMEEYVPIVTFNDAAEEVDKDVISPPKGATDKFVAAILLVFQRNITIMRIEVTPLFDYLSLDKDSSGFSWA
ncbi:hypothetical protein Ddc_09038 [Ditylenchus destructor]|nr:hypothetical protein Ddc_09038 [Ditylenchus destructor]